MEALKTHSLSPSAISDEEVVKRVLTGEKELYELLLRRYNQKLYRMIRCYLKEEQEIEDVMQNTYLKAYEKLYQFQGKALFSTWVIRIAINEALTRIKEKERYAFLEEESKLVENNLLQLADSDHMDPEKKVLEKEVRQLLEKAIDNLPLKYKTIYMLRELEEMSNLEVAHCLGISESNVKVRLHRAKLLLKESLYELSLNRQVFEFGFSRCDRMVAKVMNTLPC